MKRENIVTNAPAKGALLLLRWQVAEKLAVSIDTVKRMERRGQLRPIRLNSRMVRYRLSDVDERDDTAERDTPEGEW